MQVAKQIKFTYLLNKHKLRQRDQTKDCATKAKAKKNQKLPEHEQDSLKTLRQETQTWREVPQGEPDIQTANSDRLTED